MDPKDSHEARAARDKDVLGRVGGVLGRGAVAV